MVLMPPAPPPDTRNAADGNAPNVVGKVLLAVDKAPSIDVVTVEPAGVVTM